MSAYEPPAPPPAPASLAPPPPAASTPPPVTTPPAASLAPPPPPGPGVVPPFPAPPTDRNRRGVWIGLLAGGLALAVCFVGTIFGVGLLVLASSDQIQQQGRAAVTAFLSDVRDRQYAVARTELCADRARVTTAEDIRREFGRDQISDFQIRAVAPDSDGGLHVDTVINYAGSDSRDVEFLVVQEGTDDIGALYKVCDWS